MIWRANMTELLTKLARPHVMGLLLNFLEFLLTERKTWKSTLSTSLRLIVERLVGILALLIVARKVAKHPRSTREMQERTQTTDFWFVVVMMNFRREIRSPIAGLGTIA